MLLDTEMPFNSVRLVKWFLFWNLLLFHIKDLLCDESKIELLLYSNSILVVMQVHHDENGNEHVDKGKTDCDHIIEDDLSVEVLI